MSEDTTTQCLLFPEIFRKPVVAQFDQREGSSDGGALLLKAADRRYGLVNGVPLGLVIRPSLCSIKTTPLNFQNASVQTILHGLTKQLPYNWTLEAGTVVLVPDDLSTATVAFLQARVPPYRIAEGTLQAQAAYSWLDIRASLRPAEGTASNVLSSPESPRWPPLQVGDIAVRELFDRLVARKTGAAWILPEIEDLARATETRPFSVSDYADSRFEPAPDVCANIVAPQPRRETAP
jgi:hypothetical protein